MVKKFKVKRRRRGPSEILQRERKTASATGTVVVGPEVKSKNMKRINKAIDRRCARELSKLLHPEWGALFTKSKKDKLIKECRISSKNIIAVLMKE